jgi:hypothetical protein
MNRPIESDYTSHVAYTRALEEYCDALAQPAPVQELVEKFCDANCTWSDHHPDCKLAKREFVGLTDEEIKAFDTWHDNREEEVGWCNPSEIVAYIEAKLKEKNT